MPSATASVGSNASMAPLIDLETTDGTYGWVMWLTLIFCAACLAATGYFLLPVLVR